MARTEIVPVKSALLTWARESAGLSVEQAAKKLSINEDVLREWEASEGAPTARQLERIADVFKRPVAAFFLPEPPSIPPLPIDFRSRPGGEHKALSHKTIFAIRRAKRLQQVVIELDPDARPEFGNLSAVVDDDPATIARSLRSALGVSDETQRAWRLPGKALAHWRTAVQEAGVLVFQFSMPPGDTAGFSLAGSTPAIVLNRSDYETARMFTLFHELAHILLGKPGLCSQEMGIRATLNGPVERFCNDVSGAVLVPAGALIANQAVDELRRRAIHGMRALDQLARDFCVSRHVIARRLLTERVISIAEYRQLYRSLPSGPPPKKKRSGGGESAPLRAVRELGVPTVSRICDALDNGTLAHTEAAEYLSVGIGSLDHMHEFVPEQQ